MPLWLPWARDRSQLSPELEGQLLSISTRQMDRRLAPYKQKVKRKIYGTTKPGTLLKHQIPIQVTHWDTKNPGFLEINFELFQRIYQLANQKSRSPRESPALRPSSSPWREWTFGRGRQD